MLTPNFGDKIHYLRSFSVLEKHELNRIIDLYKALYDLNIKYNTIKSYFAKFALTGKKEEKIKKTQELIPRPHLLQ